MKNTLKFILLLLVCLSAITACKQDEPEARTPRPTWTAYHDGYYASQDLILDSCGLPVSEMDSLDLIAAFVGDSCRGVASPQRLSDGKHCFFLQVCPVQAEAMQTSLMYTLRYYSSRRGRIYVSQPIPFVEGYPLGTRDKGYCPVWQ